MKKLILILILFSCGSAEEVIPDITGTYQGTKDLAGQIIEINTETLRYFTDELIYSINENEIVATGVVSGAYRNDCEYKLNVRLVIDWNKLSGTWQYYFDCWPDDEYLPPLNVEFIKQ